MVLIKAKTQPNKMHISISEEETPEQKYKRIEESAF